jgi:paraquat-inducible protein B
MVTQSKSKDLDDLPDAEVATGRSGPSMVWLVPVVALLVGAWLVYKTLSEQGPTVTILFDTAEGIEAGKTRIKYLDVDVGVVESVRILPDESKVELKAELVQGAESKLTDRTLFWVVRPRIEGTRVSGIGTLLSGAYIGMDPGQGGKKKQKKFEGLEKPPKLLSHRKGTLYRLQAPRLGSVSNGSPVYYRQFKVGDVVSVAMAEDHSRVNIEIFIDAPHDHYVHGNSVFWNASGFELDATSEGIKLDMESLASLVQGGIAFSTPETIGAADQAPEGSLFTLYDDEAQSREKPILITVPYLLYFEDSVRGLSVGAPVEFLGIRIGTVKDISMKIDRERGDMKIGVLIGIEPERLPASNGEPSGDYMERGRRSTELLVARGFRAQLNTGNLLTGQLFVDFDFFPEAEKVAIVEENGIPVLPTMPGRLKGITDNLSSILTKLERVPFEEIGRQLQDTVAGTSRLANDSELHEAIAELNTLLQNADEAVRQVKATMSAVEGVASEKGPIGSEILNTLEELSGAARAMRVLAESLERNPEALIKGKSGP